MPLKLTQRLTFWQAVGVIARSLLFFGLLYGAFATYKRFSLLEREVELHSLIGAGTAVDGVDRRYTPWEVRPIEYHGTEAELRIYRSSGWGIDSYDFAIIVDEYGIIQAAFVGGPGMDVLQRLTYIEEEEVVSE